MTMRSKIATGVTTAVVALSLGVAGLFGITPEAKADIQWYWHDVISQCVDECPFYIEGWCDCQQLPPIIVT